MKLSISIVTILIFCNFWLVYKMGQYVTLHNISKIIEDEQLVSTDTISLEDIKLEISKLR